MGGNCQKLDLARREHGSYNPESLIQEHYSIKLRLESVILMEDDCFYKAIHNESPMDEGGFTRWIHAYRIKSHSILT